MNDFFSIANWVDFVHEEYFLPCVVLILLLTGGLTALIYLDRYKRWHATRQERNKMRQWMRPKP